MLNEWKEFQDYTGVVNYTARNKQDTTYLGRFTFDTILDFEELDRAPTIPTRGFLLHNEDGSPAEAPENASTSQAELMRLVQCARQQKSHALGDVAVRQPFGETSFGIS